MNRYDAENIVPPVRHPRPISGRAATLWSVFGLAFLIAAGCSGIWQFG